MLESIQNDKLEYQKLSREEMDKRGILGRLVGTCASFTAPTRNGRKYSEELWEQVFDNPIVKEKIDNGVLFGELGHPTDRDETDMEKIAVCMPKQPVKGSDGKLKAVFDILDTPNGRILKTLCDYGSTLGVSSRATGDTFVNVDGDEEVDPSTYDFEGFDIVLLPAVKEARLQYVTESLNKTRYNKTLKQKLQESIDKASDDDKRVMEESLTTLGINLNESQYKGYEVQNTSDGTIIRDKNGKIIVVVETDDAATEYIDALTSNEKDESISHSTKITEEEEPKHFTISELQSLSKDDLISTLENAPDKSTISGIYSIFWLSKDIKDGKEPLPSKVKCHKSVYSNHPAVTGDIVSNKNNEWTINGSATDIYTLAKIIQNRYQRYYIASDDIDNYVKNHPEIIEEDFDSIAGDSDTAIVEELQKALNLNRELDKKITSLQEKLSVSYAKENKLEEKINNYKVTIRKLSQQSKENKALSEKLSKLDESLKEKDEVIKHNKKKLTQSTAKNNDSIQSLTENVRNQNKKISNLKEQLSISNEAYNKLSEQMDRVSEEADKLRTNNKVLKEKYEKQVSAQRSLIEKYQKIARSSVNHYIGLQARKLGVTSEEIKNRLPEKYTFSDIDEVSESLQEYKVNLNSLPFSTNSLNENIRVTAKNVDNNTLVKEDPDDEISDFDLRLAEFMTK